MCEGGVGPHTSCHDLQQSRGRLTQAQITSSTKVSRVRQSTQAAYRGVGEAQRDVFSTADADLRLPR